MMLPDGSTLRYSLGSSTSSARTGSGVEPDNTVPGNCGTSSYYIYNLDNGGGALIYYGFDLKSAAVAYTANAYAINDWSDDVFTDYHSGTLAMRTHWGHDWDVWTGYGEVYGGAYLTATLGYGVTCTSTDRRMRRSSPSLGSRGMNSGSDLTEAVTAVEAFLEIAAARGREGRVRGNAPDTGRSKRAAEAAVTAFRESIAALRKASGVGTRQAEAWLGLVQTAVGALKWQRVGAHRTELVELLTLIVRGPHDDERYALLVQLVEANAKTGELLRCSGAGVREPDIAAQVASQARQEWEKRRAFVKAWSQQRQIS
ncbi:MAG: hypothetical protein K6T28_01010 [Acidothermus sp.]|nr:hypothetical protein [Acidothermus sp.]